MSLLDTITSLYAPHECVGCGLEGSILCAACRQKLPPAVHRCYRCHAANPDNKTCASCRRTSPLAKVRVLCRYEGAAKDALWQLKFGNARATSRNIAVAMVPLFEQIADKNAIVVHIPTATSRVRMRGYDQAALMARLGARRAKFRHASLLVRLGQQRQVGLRREQRLSQLENAYRVRNEDQIRGAHIVLIDDVVTTGATLEAAAKMLKQAGAKKIEAVVFAQA